MCLAAIAAATTAVHDSTFVPDHVLRVTQTNLSVACEHRLSVVVNGTSPGPTLNIAPGKSTWIRVYNDMAKENLTMHWHGLAQRMAPFADGSLQASQWPIPPGHFFDYELAAEPDDSGTYFYHSHVGMQALSASGALIVDDCKCPYKYDDERIFFFSDYFNKTDSNLTAGLQAVPFKWSGEVNSVLLNGMGIALGKEKGFSNATSVFSSKLAGCGPAIVNVSPGKTYRFRFIGSTGLSLITLGFEGHKNLTIVQVDGNEYNKPVSSDRIQLGSGQRYDVLFTAKSAEELKKSGKSSFWIQYETRDRPTKSKFYALLQYSNILASNNSSPALPPPPPPLPQTPPLTLPNETYDWIDSYQLTPLFPAQNAHPSLGEVTRRIILDTVQLISPTTNQTIWNMANLTWTAGTLQRPVLVDIYERGDAAIPSFEAAQKNGGWDPATRSFPARVGEVLEIVFQNRGSFVNNGGGLDVHPMHAHGQHVYDIGSGNGTYNATANEEKMVKEGYRAVKRDTSMLYRYTEVVGAGKDGGWRAWRIRVQQPGVWMVHCHTLQHMEMGMQTVWVVGGAEEIVTISGEESVGYLTYGGSVYGNKTHDPTCWEMPGHGAGCGV